MSQDNNDENENNNGDRIRTTALILRGPANKLNKIIATFDKCDDDIKLIWNESSYTMKLVVKKEPFIDGEVI